MRQRKGNPVPGVITAPPCSWGGGINIQGLGPPSWGSLESGIIKCGHESRGTRTSEWLRWQGPAVIVNDRPILSSERMLYKDYDRKCSVEKKSGSESQGVCRQELNSGQPPVVKWLWLWLWEIEMGESGFSSWQKNWEEMARKKLGCAKKTTCVRLV
jgi:hypothetical protein